jgi:AcrR family transcriptional regulator
MDPKSNYHHGDLRAALLTAATVELERSGYENLSLRELAGSLGVSRAAPYRHFADRQALLSALAADGFDQLTAIYRQAIETAETAELQLSRSGRCYLAFAEQRPQLFRLMFSSNLFGVLPLDPSLIRAAGACYEIFEGMVAATLENPQANAVKAATVAIMSTTYGFALLRMGGRLKPFMVGGLSPGDLVEAVLSTKATCLPGGTDGTATTNRRR